MSHCKLQHCPLCAKTRELRGKVLSADSFPGFQMQSFLFTLTYTTQLVVIVASSDVVKSCKTMEIERTSLGQDRNSPVQLLRLQTYETTFILPEYHNILCIRWTFHLYPAFPVPSDPFT